MEGALSKSDRDFLFNNEFYTESFNIKIPVLFPMYSLALSFCSEKLKSLFGSRLSIVATKESSADMCVYMPKEELDALALCLAAKFQKPAFFRKTVSMIESANNDFEDFIKKLESMSFSRGNIMKVYADYFSRLIDFRVFAAIPNILSLGQYQITGIYRDLLSKKLSNEDFSLLTNSENVSGTTLAELDLLRLVFAGKTDDASLKKWIARWGYIYYYYIGPLPSVADVKEMIKGLDKGSDFAEKRISEIKNYPAAVASSKRRIIKKLNLTKNDVHLLDVIAYFNYYKLERKELMQKSYVAMDRLFIRLQGFTGMAVDDLKFLTIDETAKLLKLKNNSRFLKLISKRRKMKLCIATTSKFIVIEDSHAIENISAKIRPFKFSKTLLVAFSGNPVTGILVVINTKADMRKLDRIKQPFILASHSTQPDLLPAMSKASGIITKTGGMTSHAAIVSRELKKPCIVGFATLFDDFKDGDMVELDTREGKITKVTK